jgi:hypothetical protein
MRHKQRLRALARDLRLCPVHVERPCCLRCDLRWEGTPAEEEELEGLVTHVDGDAHLTCPPLLPCRSCGGPWAVCLSCLEKAMARWPLCAEDRLSPEARARYDVLIQHMRPTPQRGRGHDTEGPDA